MKKESEKGLLHAHDTLLEIFQEQIQEEATMQGNQ